MYWTNWKRYWKEHLVHISTGALAGWCLATGHPAAGAGILGMIWVRQSLEYMKRHDTPGIDLAYHLGGLVLGTVAGLLYEVI